ncbi:YlbF family regulator [Christensenellaceae bacterium OttesenSCG-928-L17]|nr:YlbF family regulator [Christensenellaceae bacterium OttesenSCG-928-L17]
MSISIQDATKTLVNALRECPEYLQYADAKEEALQNEAMRGLYFRFRQVQLQLQAETLAGRNREELQGQYKRLSEILYFDEAASRLLLAEQRVHMLLGEIYKELALAVDTDLSMLEG